MNWCFLYWYRLAYHETSLIFLILCYDFAWLPCLELTVSCHILFSQVGVAEMKVAVERTGGIVVLAESFGHSVFKESLQRIFQSSDNDLGLSFK
jgi:hypothetical protein